MGRSIGTTSPSADDRTLLERVRRGDRSAYAELYERHVDAARRYARTRVSNPADADDAVADVFASVLSTIEAGKGPADDFVPYLIASVRHRCARVNRHAGRQRADDVEAEHGHDTRVLAPDALAAVDEAEVVREAYETLPAHFRDLLWHTEIAGRSHEEIAREVGSTPRAVAVMASRARQALATAYLDRHVTSGPAAVPSRSCRYVRADLAMVVRGSAGHRRLRRVQEHLVVCDECREAHDSLSRMNDHLRALPLLPIGALELPTLKSELGAKAAFLGWISTPAAKVAAAVVVGSVVLPVGIHERWFTSDSSPPTAEQNDGDGSSADTGDSLPTRGAQAIQTRATDTAPTTTSVAPGAPPPAPNLFSPWFLDWVLSTLLGENAPALAQGLLPTEDPVGQVVAPVAASVPAPVTVGAQGVPAAITEPARVPVGASVPATIPTTVPVVGSLPTGTP